MSQLDSAAIVAAQNKLCELMRTHADCITYLSLQEAMQWLERQLPEIRDTESLLVWATATEQVAADLTLEQSLWKQAFATEGYTLRLRARALPVIGSTYAA